MTTSPVNSLASDAKGTLSTTCTTSKESDEPFTVIFDDCSKGLGIKIIGGLGEEEGDQDYGVFIRKVLPGGLAAEHGTLQEGDQLLSVNGESLENVTNDDAVQLLRDASAANYVKLVVARDTTAKEEYEELLLSYSYSSANSTYDRTSLMSPASHNNGWTSPVSHTISCGSYPQTESLRQRCEGSSSGSEHGSTSCVVDMPSSQVNDKVTGEGDKVPSTVAATLPNKLFMAPGMSSTPKDDIQGFYGKSGIPDGASSGTPDCIQPLSAIYAEILQASDTSRASPSPHGTSEPYSGRMLSSSATSKLVSKGPPSAAAHGYSVTTGTGDASHPVPNKQTNLSRRLSIDPFVRIKVSKLEMALKYLGIDLKPDKYAILRNRLQVDNNGMVLYKDFVQAAKDIMKFQLDEKTFPSPPPVQSLSDIRDFTDPPAFTPEKDESYYDNVRRENEVLRNEVKKLKKLLRDKEDELIRVRQEAHGAVCESQSLRNKVHLVEQAQKAARNMEQDYEEVIRLLESENRQLRQQCAQQIENPLIQKKIAVLGCQLRKLEVTKKTYEVATEKLLHFVEVVHDTLGGPAAVSSRPESAASHASGPPLHSSKHSTLNRLATEAKDVARTVRSLLEVEPLPFGWEESYTADGMKYYINHVTQVTTWQHPLSNVQHATSATSLGNNNNNNRLAKVTGCTKPLNTTTRRKQLPSIPPTSKLKQ